MSETPASPVTHDRPVCYEIRVKGHLTDQWADWFEGLALTLEDNGDSRLIGPVVDQAALHGLLKKVRDLGLPLLLVMRHERELGDGFDDDPEIKSHSKSDSIN